MSRPSVLVLHGPNLNLLGSREPDVYGAQTLDDLDAALRAHASKRDIGLRCAQSNHEGELIDAVQQAAEQGFDAVVINPGGYTHTSVALRDAVAGCGTPVIEVHLSNTAAREPFRRRSLIAPVAVGTIAGFGFDSYVLALDAAISTVEARRS